MRFIFQLYDGAATSWASEGVLRTLTVTRRGKQLRTSTEYTALRCGAQSRLLVAAQSFITPHMDGEQ